MTKKAKLKNAKLKRIAVGEYLYDGKYYITDFGYCRVSGCRIWGVTDKDHNKIAQGMTLTSAVERLEKVLKGDKFPKGMFWGW